MNYNREKYNRGKTKLITQPIIYVEGNSNKIFYQQLNELKDKFIENGGSCNQIRQKVESKNNVYGIVDRDYENINHPKIFPIDFYSMENISLIFIEGLQDLLESVKRYFHKHDLDEVRFYQPNLIVNVDTNTKRVKNYDIILTNKKHHDQYQTYITKNIISENTFLQYKDVKKIVERYVKYLRSKQGVRLNHIIDLADHLPSKSIKIIFDGITFKKLDNLLQSKLFAHV